MPTVRTSKLGVYNFDNPSAWTPSGVPVTGDSIATGTGSVVVINVDTPDLTSVDNTLGAIVVNLNKMLETDYINAPNTVENYGKIKINGSAGGSMVLANVSSGEVDINFTGGGFSLSGPLNGMSKLTLSGTTGAGWFTIGYTCKFSAIDTSGISGEFNINGGSNKFWIPAGAILDMPIPPALLTVENTHSNDGGTIHAYGGTDGGGNLGWDFTPPPPVITSPLTAQAFVTRAFSYQITATNSPTSYDATGLPVWASINTGTGLISGTPTTAGSTSVVISATNSAGTGSATLVITAYVKNPFLTQRKQVAVKIETTESTDAAPADADCIAPIYKPEWSPSIKMLDRTSVLASFSKLPQVASERSAVIKFECELKGSGTAGTPPAFSSALKACGWGETIVTSTSVTYAPISASVPSVTVEIREGSDTVWKSKKITGARGTCSITAENGNAVKIVFTFTGKYVEPTDTVQFTQAAIGTTPPIFAGVTLVTVGVGSLKARQFSFDLGNKVVLKPDSTVSGGYYSALITDRKPTGSIDPEQETVDVVNYPSDITAAYQDVLSWSIGSSSGNRVAFSSPKCQIVSLSDSDRSGIRVENLSLAFGQNALTGNDEVSLAFT